MHLKLGAFAILTFTLCILTECATYYLNTLNNVNFSTYSHPMTDVGPFKLQDTFRNYMYAHCFSARRYNLRPAPPPSSPKLDPVDKGVSIQFLREHT